LSAWDKNCRREPLLPVYTEKAFYVVVTCPGSPERDKHKRHIKGQSSASAELNQCSLMSGTNILPGLQLEAKWLVAVCNKATCLGAAVNITQSLKLVVIILVASRGP